MYSCVRAFGAFDWDEVLLFSFSLLIWKESPLLRLQSGAGDGNDETGSARQSGAAKIRARRAVGQWPVKLSGTLAPFSLPSAAAARDSRFSGSRCCCCQESVRLLKSSETPSIYVVVVVRGRTYHRLRAVLGLRRGCQESKGGTERTTTLGLRSNLTQSLGLVPESDDCLSVCMYSTKRTSSLVRLTDCTRPHGPEG